MTRYIDAHRDRFGVEPICQTLQVAPSTYYAVKSRRPASRRVRDEELKRDVRRVHRDNFGVYGVEKIWRQLLREGIAVGRDRVARLMRDLGLAGAVRGKKARTTVPGDVGARPADLVDRAFRAPAPNRLWVADLTYVSTWSGFAYTALIVDAFSRAIVGWRVATSLRADLALDALEMAIWARRPTAEDTLVHHSDRGVQYLAIRYTERLAEEGAVHLRRVTGRQLRQRAGRDRDGALQDRADPAARTLAHCRTGRAIDRGMGRLVESAPTAQRRPPRPAGGV